MYASRLIESFYLQKESFETIEAVENCSLQYLSFDDLQHTYTTFPEFNYTFQELKQRYCRLRAQQPRGLRMQNSQ